MIAMKMALKYMSDLSLCDVKMNLNAFFKSRIYFLNPIFVFLLLMWFSSGFVISSGTAMNRCDISIDISVHRRHASIGMFGFMLYKNPDAPHESASNM